MHFNLETAVLGELEPLKALGVEVGFSDELMQYFNDGDAEHLKKLGGSSYFDDHKYKVFPDGIKIRLDEKIWVEYSADIFPLC